MAVTVLITTDNHAAKRAVIQLLMQALNAANVPFTLDREMRSVIVEQDVKALRAYSVNIEGD